MTRDHLADAAAWLAVAAAVAAAAFAGAALFRVVAWFAS